LNYEVKNDAEGILQDTHWSWGMFGYFPNYALGNLYGAQILNRLAQEIPDWKELLRQGEVLKLKEWLTKHIYQIGDLYNPLDLIKHVTGEELNPQYFINYLTEKYSQLYGF
ncbi:MAG: carboxypeptidase M32, partial [Promethearchaeota archaeon]